MFEPEPPYKNNPLYDFDNVILSPHLAGVTPEAAIAATLSVANQILQGEHPVLEDLPFMGKCKGK